MDTGTQMVQYERELSKLRRDLQATEQALSEARAELAHCRPVADAAHAYCRRVENNRWSGGLQEALLAAHQATTPSEVPSSHVIVERAELERLQAGDERIRKLCAKEQDGDVGGDYDVPISEVLNALDGIDF